MTNFFELKRYKLICNVCGEDVLVAAGTMQYCMGYKDALESTINDLTRQLIDTSKWYRIERLSDENQRDDKTVG